MNHSEPTDPVKADANQPAESSQRDDFPSEPVSSDANHAAHPTLPTNATVPDSDQTRSMTPAPIDEPQDAPTVKGIESESSNSRPELPPADVQTPPQLLSNDTEIQESLTVASQDQFVKLVGADESMATIPSAGSTRKAEMAKPRIREFGDYELLEKIAQGGMGVVFKARQISLNRLIALKMILAGQFASSEDVLRFKTEAEAAANLDHPGIVPIYEIGEYEGQHFFSMGLINGESLSQKVADGPLQIREAAELTKKITEAIAYAHGQGVIHRDLKPANILIDENGQPKVTDFGLAKKVEGGSNLTYTGQILGTPSYMPPEQAAGETYDIGPAADIYSLGAILYQLLTGRPPFQSANVMDILKQVIDQEPVAPRQLNAGISRDLETICLKCLEKKPAGRYPTAGDLADELGRYLTGQPIHARPIGTLGRFARWCHRNPWIAALSATSLLFLIAALIATSVGYVRVTAAQRRSEEGFRQARQTVNEFLTRVSEETLLNQPGMQPLKEDLLRQALNYYQRFLKDRGSDPEIVDELASTYFRVALITEQIGSPDEALAAYKTARDMQTEQLATATVVTNIRDELGTTWNAEGRVLSRLGRLEEARNAYEEAKAIRSKLYEFDATRRDFKRKLANTIMNIGLTDKAVGMSTRDKKKLEEAHKQMTVAQQLRQELMKDDNDDFVVLRDLGRGYYNLGNLDTLTNSKEGAVGHFTNAVEVFDRLRTENPGHLDDNFRLAVCHRLLGDLQLEVDPAVEKYTIAIEQMQKLATGNPMVTAYQMEHARVLMNMGLLQVDEIDVNRGLETLNSAATILERLGNNEESSHVGQRDLAVLLQTIGSIELDEGQLTSGRAKLQRARQLLTELINQSGGSNDLKSLLEETEELLQ